MSNEHSTLHQVIKDPLDTHMNMLACGLIKVLEIWGGGGGGGRLED